MIRGCLYILCSLMVFLGISCSENVLENEILEKKGQIVLDFSTDLNVSRAVEDEAHEYELEHLDVLIFESGGYFKYHERILKPEQQGTNGSGKVTLATSVDNFEASDTYWVYVIANSTYSEQSFENITLSQLQSMEETSNNLHLTGLTGLTNVPSSFLMDGIAFLGGADANEPSSKSAIKLTEVQNQKVSLKVVLRRAASKIVVQFTPASGVAFNQSLNVSAGYYVRNLPVKAFLVDLDETDLDLPVNRTVAMTSESPTDYFTWGENQVTLTMYVYSHEWKPSEVFDKGTNLVVNLPMTINGTDYENNYYQIPLSKPLSTGTVDEDILRFKRNTYYAVNVTIGAPGASSMHTPVTLDPEFSILPWKNKDVSVGDVTGPTYLKVNREKMEMYYVEEDATTLRFASSSPLNNIEVSNVYYIDKFGVKKNINVSSYQISASVENGALSGNITVRSDIPQNNTIRYFTLTITNQDGQSRTVDVMQYPLVYVVNVLGHYSYRDDFRDDNNEKATSYVNKGARIISVKLDNYQNGRWYYDYLTSISQGYYSDRGFWSSKVATADYGAGSGSSREGRSKIQYYSWGASSNNPTNQFNSEDPGNARMYHIRLTSTSEEYTLANPRMVRNDNAAYSYDYTEGSEANSSLVSPSFMTASRLGMVDIQYYGNGLTNDERRFAMARDHCAYYVEVDRQGNVYDNWRLPTKSELGIIMYLQGTANQSADAIDYLLNADYYMSATGLVYNPKNSDQSSDGSNKSQWAIRCVRNAD